MEEEVEQKESRQERKSPAKLKPVRPWTALIIWLLLNLIWIGALPMATEHPVMEPDSGFREWHEMEVPEVLGRDLPLHIECSFEPETAAGESVRVVWSLKEDTVEDPMEVRTWDANLGDDCAASDHTVPGGVYVLHVELVVGACSACSPVSTADTVDFVFSPVSQFTYHCPVHVQKSSMSIRPTIITSFSEIWCLERTTPEAIHVIVSNLVCQFT